jgi:UDP-N-acetyl-2-amino-2-deoxyglucuronate dehydrogenase
MVKLGVGIIGTGSIARTYAKCISEIADVHLVAMFSKSINRVADAEQQFNVPVFSILKEFLDQDTIDLVIVCNESGNHGEAIKSAALAGKHILCEKPLEVTPEKVNAAIEICKAQNVILGGVFQNRCAADFRTVLETVEAGLLGKLLMGNAHINWYRSKEYYAKNPWRGTLKLDGGAALMNQGIHTIDLLLKVMGPVHSVIGNIRTMVHDIEGEDVAAGIVNFKNGAMGTITAGTSLFPGYPERLEIYGEKGSIIMQAGKITDWHVANIPAPEVMKSKTRASGASDPASIGHLNHKIVIEDMVNAITQNEAPMVDGAEAKKSVTLITALYHSSKAGKMITL